MTRINLVLIDDDPDIIDSIRDFNDDRFDIRAFTSFEDGYSHLQENTTVDIIVIDYKFKSNLTGLDYIKMFKDILKLQIPFVLFTGIRFVDLEYLSSLNCRVIEKPIPLQALMNQLVRIYLSHLEHEYNHDDSPFGKVD